MRLLLNNTAHYHNGCKAVIDSYQFDDSIGTDDTVDRTNWSKYDEVILNGEGTLHHHTINSKKFLRALGRAQDAGCKTSIMNTVWQTMPNDYDEILRNCESITVREVLSQKNLKEKHDIDSVVAPDRSILVDVPYEEYEEVEVYEGQYFIPHDRMGFPSIDIFEMSWNELVNRLRHSKLLITGRHHEMYAAIKAGCPYICVEGNTWKNKGLAISAGADIPTDRQAYKDVLSGNYKKEYKKIQDYLLTF